MMGDAGADSFTFDGTLEAGGLQYVTVEGGAGADTVTTLLDQRRRPGQRRRLGRQLERHLDRPLLPAGRRRQRRGRRPPADRGAATATTCSTPATSPRGLWNRVELIAGYGNDVVVGTGQDDLIDSGFGNDRVSGLGGTDTFVDAGGTDTIVESAQADFGLYGNLLVIGTALIAGSGANRAVTGFTSATAEDISMFESAILTGWAYRERFTGVGHEQGLLGRRAQRLRGRHRERHAAGQRHDAHRHPRLGRDRDAQRLGRQRRVRRSTSPASHGTVQLPEGDGPGVDGPDTLTIVGSNLRETGRVTLGGSLLDADHNQNVETTQFTLDDGQGVPATLIISRFVETTGLYLRGGNDALAIRGLNLALTVDAGDGDDVVLRRLAGARAREPLRRPAACSTTSRSASSSAAARAPTSCAPTTAATRPTTPAR